MRDRVRRPAGCAATDGPAVQAGRGAQIDLRHGGIRGQRLEVGDVFERLRGLDVGAIGRRERTRVTRRELDRAALDAARDQRLLQAVFPGGGRRGDLRFDGRECSRRRGAPCGVRTSMCRRASMESEICTCVSTCVPPKRCAHDALDAFAHFGVVSVARHVDEAGIEALEAVAAHEQPHAAALVEIDDAAHAGDQLGQPASGTVRRAERFR